MQIQFTTKADEQYRKLIKSGQKKVVKKLIQIFNELERDPRTETASPARLRYQGDEEVWSRRIDRKNRLVYLIRDEQLIVLVISMLGHYDDR